MKSIVSYFTAPPSGATISRSSQSVAKVYKHSLEVVEDDHTEQRGSGESRELVDAPEVIV